MRRALTKVVDVSLDVRVVSYGKPDPRSSVSLRSLPESAIWAVKRREPATVLAFARHIFER